MIGCSVSWGYYPRMTNIKTEAIKLASVTKTNKLADLELV